MNERIVCKWCNTCEGRIELGRCEQCRRRLSASSWSTHIEATRSMVHSKQDELLSVRRMIERLKQVAGKVRGDGYNDQRWEEHDAISTDSDRLRDCIYKIAVYRHGWEELREAGMRRSSFPVEVLSTEPEWLDVETAIDLYIDELETSPDDSALAGIRSIQFSMKSHEQVLERHVSMMTAWFEDFTEACRWYLNREFSVDEVAEILSGNPESRS